jgi:hypothetical protein
LSDPTESSADASKEESSQKSAKILEFTGATCLEIPPEVVLKGALEAQLEEVVVVGHDAEGQLFVATSTGYRPDILYLLQLGIQETMDGD